MINHTLISFDNSIMDVLYYESDLRIRDKYRDLIEGNCALDLIETDKCRNDIRHLEQRKERNSLGLYKLL